MTAPITISYKPSEHRGQPVILLHFTFDQKLINEVKKEGAKWSQTKRAWYVQDTPTFRKKVGLSSAQPIKEILVGIHPINQRAFNRFTETLQLKSYSPNTITTYRNEFGQMLYALKEKCVDDLDASQLRSYFLHCTKTLKLSENTIHSRLNAVKFYFEQVLHRERLFAELPRPKKPSILPQVINAQDIKKILAVTTNLKHNTMLKICYGLGLRVSELIKLKIVDIDSKSMQVFIERAKGKKDRYANLPETILGQLRDYYKQYRPTKYLFEGKPGEPYSTRSAQSVFTKALKSAKINKTVGIHGLRHSFATHLLENGTDVIFIQQLLGHNDVATTMRYTHVSQKSIKSIKSPLDLL